MTAKGNILKDSFYKERLARTSNHIIKGYTTTNFAPAPLEEESDTDAIVISAEYIAIHVDRNNSISNSISPILVKLHAEPPLPLGNLYALISVFQLYMYPFHKIETRGI